MTKTSKATTYKVGDVLICHDTKNSNLTPGNPVVVSDPDKYPDLRTQLIRKVGYETSKAFVCVEDSARKRVGFYICTRFRKVAKGKEVKA